MKYGDQNLFLSTYGWWLKDINFNVNVRSLQNWKIKRTSKRCIHLSGTKVVMSLCFSKKCLSQCHNHQIEKVDVFLGRTEYLVCEVWICIIWLATGKKIQTSAQVALVITFNIFELQTIILQHCCCYLPGIPYHYSYIDQFRRKKHYHTSLPFFR